MRGEGQPVVLLDAGGFFGAADESTSSLEDQLRGRYLLEAMDTLAYDAVNVGYQDVRFGETYLTERLAGRTFRLVSSNLVWGGDGSLYASASTVVERGGYAVGVIGVTSDSHAAEVAHESDAAGERLDLTAAADAVDAALPGVDGADLVVLLAFGSAAEAEALAGDVPEVDVVVHAGGNVEARPASTVGDQWSVPAGYDGKWVVRLDLDESKGAWSERFTNAVAIDGAFANEGPLADHYQAFLGELADAADEIVAGIEIQTPEGGSYVGSEVCAACHPAQHEQWSGTPHSHAFDTLVETNHDWSPSCYSCHTIGFGYEGGFLLPTDTPDRMHVGCEMCHGAGAEHIEAPGPGWAMEPTAQCIGCHTPEDSPQFDMGAYLPQVVH